MEAKVKSDLMKGISSTATQYLGIDIKEVDKVKALNILSKVKLVSDEESNDLELRIKNERLTLDKKKD